MEITQHYEIHEIENIIKNPVLFNCTYGQDVSPSHLERKEFLLVKEGNIDIGCFEIRDLTKVTIEAHIFVLPKYWGRTKEIVNLGHMWAKEQGYHNVFTSIPKNCIHMLKFAARFNYQACGTIPNGIVYNGKLVDLFLFNYNLCNENTL